MNEDELKIKLKQVKDFLNKNEESYAEDLPIYMFWRKEDVEAIETILDLYQQEREKNKELIKRNKALSNNMLSLACNSISKDKIRVKIKELEEEQKEYKGSQEWEIQDDIDAQINILKELLEEN